EDFGTQGDLPTHPELLDWLATEFVAQKWDVKAFLKMLVTSATYCQTSRVTPQLEERDPENLLLARGPRFRAPAEVVRDQALAVRMSGADGGAVEKAGYGFRLCLARPPRADELKQLVDLFTTARTHYTSDPEQAKKMAVAAVYAAPQESEIAELAAWTTVAN